MPIYEYRRPDGTTFELQQSFSDEPLAADPDTGVPVERVLHPPAVHFKGKGFYNTDYGTRKRQRESAAGAEGASGDDAKGAGGAEKASGGERDSAKGSAAEKRSGGEGSGSSSSASDSAGAGAKEGSSAKGSKRAPAKD